MKVNRNVFNAEFRLWPGAGEPTRRLLPQADGAGVNPFVRKPDGGRATLTPESVS